MSNAADVLPLRIARAAAAIANARAGRRGAPPIENILDLLPENLFLEVVEDARAALEIPPTPRADRRLTAADADALRLDLGAGSLIVLIRDHSSRAAGVVSAAGAGAQILTPAVADGLWSAFASRMRAEAAAEPASLSTPALSSEPKP